MDDLQQARIAINESRFRDANERARHGMEDAGIHPESFTIMCECALSECDDMIELTWESYLRARANRSWFIVLPDHVIDASERTIERHDGCWFIVKQGIGGAVAHHLARDD